MEPSDAAAASAEKPLRLATNDGATAATPRNLLRAIMRTSSNSRNPLYARHASCATVGLDFAWVRNAVRPLTRGTV